MPSRPSAALRTCEVWSLTCCSVRCLEARPGHVAAHGRRSPCPPDPPAPFTPVGRGAGVCSVSGETDDTIASQIHPFLALFHRAKASWVSYRRPEVPALVLTVTCCGAVSSMGATKFARRGLSVTIARKYAPSAGRMAQNERYIAGWASVFASVGGWGVYWANVSALRHLHQVPKPSTGTEVEPFHECLPSRPTKRAAEAQVCSSRAHRLVGRGGFCTTRSCSGACHRRVGSPCSAIPPNQPCASHDARGAGAQNADHLAE